MEYFDPGNHAAQSSFLVSDFSPYLLVEQDAKQEVGLDYDLNISPDSPVVSTLLDPDTNRWVEVSGLAPVLSYGEAYAIFVQSSQRTFIAVLINDVKYFSSTTTPFAFWLCMCMCVISLFFSVTLVLACGRSILLTAPGD